MGFNDVTRLNTVQIGTITRPTGGGVSSPLTLPKTGLLKRLHLIITGAVSGTLSAPNALGMASIVSRVRLTLNSGIDVFNLSGAAYHYLLRNFHDINFDPLTAATPNNARAAVTATTYNISMVIDVMVNSRDPLGLILLQNEQTQATLTVEWLADASVAAGATVTGTCVVYMEYFTVPQPDPKDPAGVNSNMPPLNLIHQTLEDQQTISAAGDYVYQWLRGNIYLQVLHGLGIGVSGADSFTRARLRLNQSNFIYDFATVPQLLDMQYAMNHPAARLLGVIPFDLIGSSGLGQFGMSRDMIDSARLTDIATVIAASGAATLYTVRRQLVRIAAPQG